MALEAFVLYSCGICTATDPNNGSMPPIFLGGVSDPARDLRPSRPKDIRVVAGTVEKDMRLQQQKHTHKQTAP